jgi:hypothetical protein
MTILYPLLLGGLILAGIPVLLHLIMRQKPKHLVFPAFRFLLQRHRSNQRRLQLRHLLLLALRLLLIIGVCLALARPKLFSERLSLSSDRPVAAVLLFDTSYSMEYTSGGQTRLDRAKQQAQELLNQLPPESRVAVLDTAEPGGEWLPSLSLARDRISDRRLRSANGPLTTRLPEAYRLFTALDQEAQDGTEPLPRFLYLFSDRTQESWDAARSKDLQALRDRLQTPLHAIFVDVGVDKPADVALVSLELPHQAVASGDRVQLDVTVRAIGMECETEAICRVAGEKTAEHKPIKLSAGQSQKLSFERRGLTPGLHQAEITLATKDALPFDNALFATFEVRRGRRVLILVDDPFDAAYWQAALESTKGFQCEVRRVSEVNNFSPQDLIGRYQAICLLNVAKPSHDLWEKLSTYRTNGGGLAIMPGETLDKQAYDDVAAQELLPGRFVQFLRGKLIKQGQRQGATWKTATYQHPVMAPFREWSQSPNIDFVTYAPEAYDYWEIEAHASDAFVVVNYADAKSRPALLERPSDKKHRGRVLLFTTPLDFRHLVKTPEQRSSDYLETSFRVALPKVTMSYLAGDAEKAGYNYAAGQPVTVVLPGGSHSPTYTLQGPGLSAEEALIPHAENRSELLLPQAVRPGNYTLVDQNAKAVTSFSVNMPPEECQLARVPPEPIEDVLGAGAIVPVGHQTNLREALQGHWSQPVDLFPWLMIVVLLALAVENLLANKFYRRETAQEEQPAPDKTAEQAPAVEA